MYGVPVLKVSQPIWLSRHPVTDYRGRAVRNCCLFQGKQTGSRISSEPPPSHPQPKLPYSVLSLLGSSCLCFLIIVMLEIINCEIPLWPVPQWPIKNVIFSFFAWLLYLLNAYTDIDRCVPPSHCLPYKAQLQE